MTQIGQYRLLDRIGEGGMGAVFRGEDTMLQRQVAIKVLRPELARQQALVDRFRTEAVALARLNHPNIATVYGLLQQDGQYYMVLEYVDGQTLEAILARRGRLPWSEAVSLARDTLAALDHAHGMGVVHRDLKPANLMVTRTGQLKVMDFGIARLAGTSRHTEYGRIVGTPLYMSPEQLRGEEVDGRSDVYSLGVVLYELLTGREAFQADSDYALLMAQLNQMPEPLSRYVPDLPADLEMVLGRALSKSRNDRWRSATDFRRALNRIEPEPVTRPTGEIPVPVAPAIATVVAPDAASADPTKAPAPATRLADAAAAPATRLSAGAAPATRVADHGFGIEAATTPSPIKGWHLAIGGTTVAALAAIIWLVTKPVPAVQPPPAPGPVAPTPAPVPTPPPAAQTPGAATIAQRPVGQPDPAAPTAPVNYGVVADPVAPPKKKTPAPSGPPSTPSTTAPKPESEGPPPTTSNPEPAANDGPDLSTAGPAFRAGLGQVGGWLKGRDRGQVERTFSGPES